MRVRALVNISDDPSGHIEGHYLTPDSSQLRLTPSGAICPFCFATLQVVTAPRLGRIGQEIGKRSAKEADAVVELLPSSHEALKCSGCEIVLTRPKEEQP